MITLKPLRFEWKDAGITPTVRCSVCRSFTGQHIDVVRWRKVPGECYSVWYDGWKDDLCVKCQFWLWRVLRQLDGVGPWAPPVDWAAGNVDF